MELIPITSVSISERQRKYFDLGKLIELADDIRHNGLLHAPVLQAGTHELLAGERRVRAMEIIYNTEGQFMYAGELVPHGMVPVTRAHSRDILGWMEAELAENLARQDLTWQERAQAMLRLDALRRKQDPAHSILDTFAEIKDKNPTAPNEHILREELVLANHLEDPEIAKQKSRQDAMKVLRRKAQMQRAEELGRKFQLESSTTSPHTAIGSNCREYLPTLPSGTFDLILSDPPYGTDADSHGSFNALGHQYEDDYLHWRELMLWFSGESFRLAKPQSHLYLFCDIERWPEMRTLFASAGWNVWTRPLIWSKGNGIAPRPDYGPRFTYEAILFAAKGDRKILTVGKPDVIQVPMVTHGRVHGAEKPVAVYVELMSRSCMPGDTVLDPFMGSGTIFPAANLARLRATGVEQSPAFFGVAITRLEGTQ